MESNFNEKAEIWDDFVSTSPHRSIFASNKFIESLKTKYNLVTCYDQGSIVAGAVMILSDLDSTIENPFPFTMYQGILLSDNSHMKPHSRIPYEQKTVEFFLKELVSYYNKLCLCQSWKFCDMRAFQWYNYGKKQDGLFDINLRYTGILDLSIYNNFENYLSSIRTVRRQEYNKAAKLLQIKITDDEGLLDELHYKTFERQGIQKDLKQSILVRSITKSAIANNYGGLKCAMLDDVPVSAILFLYYNKIAYYIFGATNPEYRNTFAGTYLLTDMIKDAFSRDLKEVDFVGVNSPNRGDYKISFNAELKPYFITTFGFNNFT